MHTVDSILREINAREKMQDILIQMEEAKSKSWRKDLQNMYFNNSLRLERTKN
jgi:hypothetical protein